MKRIIALTVITLFFAQAKSMAEDVIQILPTVTFAGATEDDGQFLEVQMTNDTYDEVGIVSFDMLLPEGISFLYEDFEGERIPYTKKGSKYDYDFSLFDPTVQTSGYTRYMLVPGGKLRPMTGKSGTFMYLYFETDASMKPGIYPIFIQETVIGKSENEGLYPGPSVSYIVVKPSDEAASPLATEAYIDLSALASYVPSFVVEQLSDDLADNENLVSVNLSGATELGAELSVKDNVVWWTSKEATLNRTFKAGQWQSVCLPFAVSGEQVGALKNGGCEIEQLTAFDEGKNTVTFSAVDEMEANQPYIVKTDYAGKLFSAMKGVTVAGLTATSDVTFGSISMHGTYTPETLNSDNTTTYFAYDDSDGSFVRIGSNATVSPFRAYLVQSGGNGARKLFVFHDNGDGGVVTGVGDSLSDKEITASDNQTYNLQGQRIAQPRKGVYVKHGKKIIK